MINNETSISQRLGVAQLQSIEAEAQLIVTRAEKLKSLRELLHQPVLQTYLLTPNTQQISPFLAVYNTGKFSRGYTSYDGGEFTPAMILYFSRATGHVHTLIPQPDDGIVYLQDSPDPTNTSHGLVNVRSLKSGYWLNYQEAGFRFYDDHELQPPTNTSFLRKILGFNDTQDALICTAEITIRPAYQLTDTDPRPVLQRFVGNDGVTRFKNLAADSTIHFLDPFNMNVVTNAIEQAIAHGE